MPLIYDLERVAATPTTRKSLGRKVVFTAYTVGDVVVIAVSVLGCGGDIGASAGHADVVGVLTLKVMAAQLL